MTGSSKLKNRLLNPYVVLTSIVFGAFLIRIYRLGTYSLWMDEADTIYSVVNQVLFYPPFFYSLLKLWMPFADSEWSFRLFPVLINLIGIVCFWFLVRHIANVYSAHLATAILSFMPFVVYYSRELRMYSLLLTLSIISWLLFFMMMESRRFLWVPVHSVVSAMIIYTYPNSALFIISQSTAVFCYKPFKTSVRKVVYSLLGALLLFTPWLPRFIFLYCRLSSGEFWTLPISWRTFFHSYSVWVSGYETPLSIATTISLLTGLLFCVGIWRSKNSNLNIYVLFGFFLPVLGAMSAGLILTSSFFIPRYFVYCIPPVATGVAMGILRLPGRVVRLSAGLSLFFFLFFALTFHYRNEFYRDYREVRPRKDFRRAAEFIE